TGSVAHAVGSLVISQQRYSVSRTPVGLTPYLGLASACPESFCPESFKWLTGWYFPSLRRKNSLGFFCG
ncbi:MAG: hypothetical protein ACI8PT_003826, partial [Gammaproteobacteria bacterium]